MDKSYYRMALYTGPTALNGAVFALRGVRDRDHR